MKRILLFILCFVTIASVHAQKAKLIGKVTNVKNELLVGVTVTLKSDKNLVSKTDIEGRFSFNIDINKAYNLDLSYVGYKIKTIEVSPAKTINEEVVIDVLLE